MAFVATSAGHLPFHDAGETYVDAPQHQHQHNPYANHASMPDRFGAHVPHHMSCDIKPRLTKEQHDILEAHYQKQQKPNTNTKKGFADSLGVSLDKVNNWFQNRRAKSKQDAKKQAGAYNLFNQPPPPPTSNANYPSDSDTSPSFTSADYFSLMQQCTADDSNASNGMPMSSMPQYTESVNGLPYTSNDATPNEHYSNGAMGQQLQGGMFDSPQELNRRTLTQEQFDAFAQNGGMTHSGHFDTLHHGFSGDADVLHQVFPEMSADFKPQDAFAFPAPMGAPLSSNDSSIPSTISEQSMFPSSTAMQEQHAISAPSSDWGDSRSSSVSLPPNQDMQFHQVPASQQPPNASTSQWQPGQSVPVDPNELQQQFREAAQRQQQIQQQHHEQPLAWPADEAFVRRDSQNGTMLAQQLSNFGIQTSQPQQSANFKTPAPPGEHTASIAVRRQRPKPQPLGMAALRSQSYSGAVQPASPGQQQSQNLSAPGQQLRRIRSTNVINGVAQGRVMKSGTGSAQRSPLNWTFSDAAANSPKMMRHAASSSMGNLAPPTPMSPNEAAARQEQPRPQFPPWQSASGHFSRQASISETDAEHNVIIMPSQSVPSQPVSSPPHTPLYHHHQQQSQQFSQTRVGNNVITENTPPQSAPAAQTSFPTNVFMVAPQHQQQPMPQPQQMQAFMPAQPQYMSASMPEQGFQVPATYGPAQHFVIPAPDGPAQMSMAYPNGGVPVVNAQGNLTMAYPPQMQQQMQFIQHAPPQAQGQPQPPQMHTPPQVGQQFSFVTTSGASPGISVTAQLPKPAQPASEFFVHEYTPPQDIKRTATPRKPPTESHGPKNYTFANQGPEHFEKEKVKRGDKSGTASNSPASATSSS